MKPIHVACALCIVLLGVAGALLSLRSVPPDGARSTGADAGPARTAVTPAVAGEAGPAGAAPPGVFRSPYHLLEQDSPAIDRGGRLTQAIGIEMPRGTFIRVLEAGSIQPAWKAKTYGTARPGQDRLLLHVMRGNSDRIPDNRSLGWIQLRGFRPGADGLAAVAIAFRIADGNIVLGAIDVNTRQPVSVETVDSPLER